MRVRTDEKRQEILRIAQQVFREKGYAETSMAEIASRLGGSKSTAYSYFPSKEDLFVAVMLDIASRSAEAVLDELERAGGGDMRANLAQVMEKIIRVLCSPEMIDFRRMAIAEAGRSDLGKRIYERGPGQYLKRTADLFAVQIREGHIRRVDPWQAAVHMMSLCMGAPVQQLLEGAIERPSDQELAAAAAAAADVFYRAYAPDAAVAPRRRTAERKTRRNVDSSPKRANAS